MQLLLSGERPVLVTLAKAQRSEDRIVEFHTPNENGTTTVTIAVIVGSSVGDAEFRAIGSAVWMCLT